MKVKELIEHLKMIPQDADIYSLAYKTIDDLPDVVVNYNEQSNSVCLEFPTKVII